jgi:hypothetical protein
MAHSFLPNNEDSPINTTLTENYKIEQNNTESIMESIPETEMPLDALEGHPAENEHFLEEAPEPIAAPVHIAPPTTPVRPIPQVRDTLAVQIEKIMEENLGDVYSALTPVQKQQFKIKGEETANKIKHILETTTAKLGKIVKLIFEWLKILPGINHFFLEQEAKIKAEKIITLGQQKKHIQ